MDGGKKRSYLSKVTQLGRGEPYFGTGKLVPESEFFLISLLILQPRKLKPCFKSQLRKASPALSVKTVVSTLESRHLNQDMTDSG